MLKYLITGTNSMIAACVLAGMLAAYLVKVYGDKGKIVFRISLVAGFLAAVVMAYMKNKTKLINTATWNLYIFSVALAAFLLFAVLDGNWFRKLRNGRAAYVPLAASGILNFTLVFYTLPDVLAYPYNFVLGGEAVLSTGFLYRLIGLILGLLLCVLSGFAVNRVSLRSKTSTLGILLKLALLVNALQQLSKIFSTLLSRRIISSRALFRVVRFTANNANLFIYAILILTLILPLLLWLLSFRVQEKYENPAQHRKIKAKWRSSRRWSTTVGLCFVVCVVILTAVDAYANRPVALSAVEECEMRGSNLYIPFEQVEDGHLHRFAYTTDNNIAVRFIIIQKPNSSAFGVGLDACDICGETGYYERGGQVVCNRCDVVMNINTIGFKGGCNPKVIDYSIENGYIIVPTYTLIEHESDFK